MQKDLFNGSNCSGEIVNLPDGQYRYFPNFFDKEIADKWFNILIDSKHIDWQQEQMKMFGKMLKFPRLTAWYGDEGKVYSYAGLTFYPNDWTPTLIDIKRIIEPICNTSFNSVLLNLYRNGNDSMSWHADSEKELGQNPIIASVNLGTSRVFQMRHNHTKQKESILLEHGSLFIMQGQMQHFWSHQLPKRKNISQARINLTFRKII